MNKRVPYRFCLYVAGRSANSVLAVDNLNAICSGCLPEAHEVEIIDVLKQPDRALKDGILVTPTLVRLAPVPPVRVIGNLSQRATVLAALGVEEKAL